MEKPGHPQNPTRTIGFLLDWFTSAYHLEIWSGVVQAAKERNVNLLTFIGGRLKAPYLPEAQSNIIYEMAAQEQIDGLLMLSATTAGSLTPEERDYFLAQFHQLPFVSIGELDNNIPYVNVDNVTGMQEGIEHLIRHHDWQHFAFIGGPADNPDAQQRLQVYKETLAAYDLPLNEDLIFFGDFLYESGYRAANQFMQQGLTFDAIVAANDGMGVGALEALRHHGISVPQQVGIIGFDDSDESQVTTPMLTTVRQPIFEIGFRAVERLLDEIEGKPDLEHEITLPAKLVLRQSCGCQLWDPTYLDRSEDDRETAVSRPSSQTFLKQLQKDKANLSHAMNTELEYLSLNRHNPAWINLLLNGVEESVRIEQTLPLLTALNDVVNEMMMQTIHPSVLLDSMVILYQYLFRNMGTQIGRIDVNNSWLETRMLIDSANQRILLNEKVHMGRLDYEMRTLGLRLASQHELSDVFDTLLTNMPLLGLRQFYLVLYDEQQSGEDALRLPQWSRLVFAYDEGDYLAPDIERQHFLTQQILPSYLFSPKKYLRTLILPLYSHYKQFGYMLLTMDDHTTRYHYDSLRTHISVSLQSVLPKIRLQAHRAQLESEMTTKAYELALANEQMKTYMTKLEQRNRGLKQFNHIASHEFQEPLRKIQVFCDRVLAQYGMQMDEKGRDYIIRLQESSSRLHHLVDDLMNFTQVTAQSRFQDIVNLNDVLEEAIDALHNEITAVNAQIITDELPTIEANASQLRQVFYHLIANSLKFRSPNVVPEITIQSQLLPGETISNHYWQITLGDNGIGFDEKYGEKIFAIFQRLHSRKAYEGTGIGLAVCQRAIELHHGTITAQSKPNQGTQFIITLPASQS